MLSGTSSTLVISRPDMAATLRKTLGSDAGTLVVDVTDAEAALRALTRASPDLVVLDRGVLETPHWRSLVARVRRSATDPRMAFRILSPLDLKPEAASVRAMIEQASQPFPGGLSRRVPRYQMADGVVGVVNGATSSIVDLSVLGAQLLSHAVLRPNERVGIRLLGQNPEVVVRGAIAWSLLEQARDSRQLHYRAGVEFIPSDADALERYCARHGRDADAGPTGKHQSGASR